jgi:sigma-B regulation protein RsbU (phosphoserine phosphatase)
VNSKTILFACANEPDEAIRTALEQAGCAVQSVRFGALPPEGWLAVVDAGGAIEAATAFCRQWRGRSGGHDAPVLWLADSLDPYSRTAGWDAGADAVLVRPLAPGELPAQITNLANVHDERQRLTARANEAGRINQSLVDLYRQVDADFQVARRIQRACRPTNFLSLKRARLAVTQREQSASTGDFYCSMRVDEETIAFLVGDAIGQSITACMLAVFLHQVLRPKEILDQGYRLLPPDEVLKQLNHELVALGMPEPPIVRMTYGLVNGVGGEFSCACAGHTPPLYLPKSGSPALWRNVGPMLGGENPVFPIHRCQLQAGDRILIYTDGLHGARPEETEALLTTVKKHRDLPLQGQIECVTQDLLTQTSEPDDFTMLGIEYMG